MKEEYKKILKEHIKGTWEETEKHIMTIKNTKLKGDIFELIILCVLHVHPYFKGVDKAWLYDDTPSYIIEELKLPDDDHGIDIIAMKNNEYYAIQCKFRSDITRKISWGPPDKTGNFAGLSNRPEIGSKFTLVTNCNRICEEMMNIGSDHLYGQRFRDIMSDEHMENIISFLDDVPTIKKNKFKPRNYQKYIINETIKELEHSNKCMMIMPCGGGKTLTSLWIAKALNHKTNLILVSSLSLSEQIYLSAYKQHPNYEFIILASSGSNKNYDSRSLITTTDLEEIEFWFKKTKGKRRFIISTYHSSHLIKNINIPFDMGTVIYDEAHNTMIRSLDDKYNSLLKWDKCKHKLFMTATPLYNSDPNDKSHDMNDESIYGRITYKSSLHNYIKKGILCSISILNPSYNDEYLENYINKYNVHLINEHMYSKNMIQSLFPTLNLINDGKVRKVLVYLNSIKNVKQYYDLLNEIININDLKKIKCFKLEGTYSMSKRHKIFNEFKNCEIGILINAKVLNEGVNIECADCAVIIDPRYSSKDLMQISGRISRLFKNKKMAYVLLNNDNPRYLKRFCGLLEQYKFPKKNKNIKKTSLLPDNTSFSSEIVEESGNLDINELNKGLTYKVTYVLESDQTELNQKAMLDTLYEYIIKHGKLPNEVDCELTNFYKYLKDGFMNSDPKILKLIKQNHFINNLFLAIKNDKVITPNLIKNSANVISFVNTNKKLPKEGSTDKQERKLGKFLAKNKTKYRKGYFSVYNLLSYINKIYEFFIGSRFAKPENRKNYIIKFIEEHNRLPKEGSTDKEEKSHAKYLAKLKTKFRKGDLSVIDPFEGFNIVIDFIKN